MNTINSVGDNDQRIFTEQIKVLYQMLPAILFAGAITIPALVYAFWDVVPHHQIFYWLTLILLVNVARLSSVFVYRRYYKPEQIRQYAFMLAIGHAAAGIAWGAAGVLLFPQDQLEYQLFILVVLAGIGLASTSSHSAYLPAYFAFFPITFLPVTIMFFMVDDRIHQSMGMIAIGYIIALSYYGIHLNKQFNESLKLRFENMDLVEQLRIKNREAEMANISKSKFLAAASHDLRQPLHALTLFTSVLDELIQYPKVRAVVDQINSSVDALQNLFNALLDISQLDAGVMKVDKIDFYLQPLCKKLSNEYDAQAGHKGLKITWPTENFAVHSDPLLLERIMRNFISNAIRYTGHGEISIRCEANDGVVRIGVADTGIGIPQEDMKAIFDEFYQVNIVERDRSKGLGLGLAIVQRTANLLGHDINVASQEGKGSVFSIMVRQAFIAGQAMEAGMPAEAQVIPETKTLIVVIDDERDIRAGTQALYEQWGCDVIAAANQNEAIAQLGQLGRLPHGIISDYRLSSTQTGIEAIHAIYETFNINVPAIIVSGDIAIESLRKLNSTEFQMLHKPVSALKLRTFLRQVQLQQSRKNE